MASRRVFIFYDFEIKGGLTSDFEFAKSRLLPDIDLEWPGSAESARQGEIWRNLVRPQLESATQFVAFLDLPNANVGFEVGYALGRGEGKKAALARVSPNLPAWLKKPPLKGFYCEHMRNGQELVKQITSEDWITIPKPPPVGNGILLLCPHVAGVNFRQPILEQYRDWQTLPEEGWSLVDLPGQLQGVGTVVWLILPHREGPDARDGSENAAASVVAGYAHACGMQLKVLVHSEARVVVDVAPQSFEFAQTAKLLEHVKRIDLELKAAIRSRPPAAIPPGPPASPPERHRPEVGPLPELSTAGLRERFIGRGRLLGDFADALRGLESRRQGEPTQGAAKVQAIWYHGFGGMGKSWFLRRAILQAQESLPSAKVALVDWDQPTWRVPLSQPPETPRELLEPIARRVAQLYGVAALDAYWSVERRTREAEPEASRLRERFQQRLLEFQADKETDDALRSALAQKNVSVDGPRRVEEIKLLKQDRLRLSELFVSWFENGGAAAEDPEAILRPDALRTSALQDCMRTLAIGTAPLILVLDTCEVIASDLERWLRQLIAPLSDGRTPFLVLIGSRLPPDVAEPPGSRDVWRAAVGEERWRHEAFNEGWRFTVQEIALALAYLKPPLHDPELLAEQLHRVTLGVPLALRSLIDLHEEGDDVLARLEDLEAPDDDDSAARDAEARVVETVADRFLLHLSNRRDREFDFRDIIALALMHEINRELLKKLWSAENITGRLRELARRYSLLAVGDLHATVRSFLRRRWRTEDRPVLVNVVIAELQAAVTEVTLPGLPGEPQHMKALAVRLNAAGWGDARDALQAFAPAVALALAFDEHVHLLVELAAEIPQPGARGNVPRALRRLAGQLRSGSVMVPPWGSDDVFAWLEDEERTGRWAPVEKAALELLRGFRRARAGQQSQALAPLLSALDAFADYGSPPRSNLFGEALFDVAYSLKEASGRESDVIAAYSGARRLNYAQAASANNTGAILDRLGKTDEAERRFREAVEMDATEPLYPRNLGDILLRQKRYDEAESSYRKAIEIDSGYAAGYNSLALLFKARRRYEDAEAQLRKAMDAKPTEPVYPRNLGELLRERKRYDEAESWYRKAIEIDPRYAATYNGLGLLFKARGRHDDAEAYYRKAMEVDPTEPIYPNNLGALLRERKRYDEAEPWYRKAIEVAPGYAAGYNGLALLFKARGRDDDAEAQFRKAMEVDPTEPIYPDNLADLLRERKRYDEAEPWYRKATEIAPGYAAGYNGLALLFKARGHDDDAEAQFRKAMEVDPTEPIYPRNLGDLLRERKRYDEAEPWFRKAIEIAPGYAEGYNGFALLFKARGRHDDAEAQFRKAIEVDPTEPIYPRNLGDLLRERKRYDEAESWYRKAIEVAPGYAAAYNGLALLFKARGRDDDAEAYYRKAMEVDPTEPIYPNNLGALLRERKRYDEAEPWYRKAIEVAPRYAAAYNGLALLSKARGRHDDAETQFRKAMEVDPTEPIYPDNLADLLRERKRYDEAEPWYRKATEIAPGYAAAYNGLALLFKARGRDDDAEAQFRKAMEVDPTEPIYPDNLGDLLCERKRYDEAESWYRKAIEIDSGYAAGYNGLALLFKERGHDEDAEAQFRKAIEVDPNEPIYHTNLGALLERLNRDGEAESCYRKALQIASEDAEPLNSLAWFLYTRTSSLDEAERLAQRAVTLSPDANFVHSLAVIRLRRHGWLGASDTIFEWMRLSDAEHISDARTDVVKTLKDAMSLIGPAPLASALRAQALGGHWTPWLEAIECLAGASLRLDPEAQLILADLKEP